MTKRTNRRFLGILLSLLLIGNAIGFAQQVTSFPSQSLAGRLENIIKKGNVTVVYDVKQTEGVHLPALRSTGNNPEVWLRESLAGSNFKLKKLGNTYFSVVAKPKPRIITVTDTVYRKVSAAPKSAAKGTLAGKVVDDTGETLIGASVKVLGNGYGGLTGVDGDYSFLLPAGTYTIEVNYISYQTQQITDVIIKPNEITPLNVVMTQEGKELQEVTVTANYNRSSAAGAIQIQKLAPQVSAVLSSEQISKTPDKNVQEALKRVTGVTLVDNKNVSVRGMSERWNSASLDGVVLPSTEAGSKGFSFDLIPASLIENITVSKSITPDMNATFAGGYVQVFTRDIPQADFFTVSVGGGVNDQGTFKEMWMPKRGKLDYLGFDDGRRAFPSNDEFDYEASPITFETTNEKIYEHSKLFKHDLVTPYKYTSMPNTNAQITWGKVFRTESAGKLGLVTALSFRNTQSVDYVIHTQRGDWHPRGGLNDSTLNRLDNLVKSPKNARNQGHNDKFSTILSGIVNTGWEFGRHHIGLRNMYTRKFDNSYKAIDGVTEELGSGGGDGIISYASPIFQDLLQNKLEGRHKPGIFTIDWTLSHTYVGRRYAGAGRTQWMKREGTAYGEDYLYWNWGYGGVGMPRSQLGNYMGDYRNRERMLQGEVSASVPFNLGPVKNTFKAGGMMNYKKAEFAFREVALGLPRNHVYPVVMLPGYEFLTFQDALSPERMHPMGFALYPTLPDKGTLPQFKGNTREKALFAMLDHRWSIVRLVWGARIVNYKYVSEKNQSISGSMTPNANKIGRKDDKPVDIMPSVNLTVSPAKWMDVRLSYYQTALRPEMQERVQFAFYDPIIGSERLGNDKLNTTDITAYDGRIDFFPGAGEIISVGGFYRYLDNPIELVQHQHAGHASYILENSNWAKNWGYEFEVRKNLGFIAPVMKDFWFSGNLALVMSKIETVYGAFTDLQGKEHIQARIINRPLYGQTPYIYNVGLMYDGPRFGANVVYNTSGRRVLYYSYARGPGATEYQDKDSKLDAQLSYRFKKPKIHVKLNFSNLLAPYMIYYWNTGDYEQKRIQTHTPEGEPYLKTDYVPLVKNPDVRDDDDAITYITHPGRTFSFSVSWDL